MIGPYQVQEELGRGFSSVVSLAVDTRRGRTVALKLLTFPSNLPPALRADLTERFRREARAVAGLTHPHIVSVFDVGETSDGQPFLALERLCGQSLRQRLRSAGRLPMAEALPIALHVAEALEYAHGRGIVHRDIKPDNIFLCLPEADAPENSAAIPKLMDFGISRTLSDQELTQDGMVVGSPAYMSPEQISGEPVDGRADVFSLAVTLAEMLTGAKPFEGDTVPAVMRRILHQPPQFTGLDHPRLERVLRKALAKRPGQRYSSVADFAAALRRIAPLSAPAPSVATQFVQPVRARAKVSRQSLWLGTTALVGAAVGIGAVQHWPPAPPRTASAAVRTAPPRVVRTALTVADHTAPRNAQTAHVTVRTVPVYVYQTRVIKTFVPKTFVPVKPALPKPTLAAAAPFHPTVPRLAVLRSRPHSVSAGPRLALRPVKSLRLSPPPVVVALAATTPDVPVVRVSDARQEMTRRPSVAFAPDGPALQSSGPESVADSPPRLLSRTEPTPAPGTSAEGQQVTMHLHINRFGEVTDADVVESSGSEDLDNAALDAVGDWTYAPAMHRGRPVRSETEANVTFTAP